VPYPQLLLSQLLIVAAYGAVCLARQRECTARSYWESIDGSDRAATLKAPVLLMAGWLDPFLPGQLADFVRICSGAAARFERRTSRG
jgi:predicted acyl esterase